MNFLKAYFQPAIESGVLEMTVPDKLKSRDQQYRLTNAGQELKKGKGKGKKFELTFPISLLMTGT